MVDKTHSLGLGFSRESGMAALSLPKQPSSSQMADAEQAHRSYLNVITHVVLSE